MFFTDFVPGVEEQNFCGWFMILVTLFNMLVNLGFAIAQSARPLALYF